VIAQVPGVAVGHWTDTAARTGCTAILFPEGTVASGEVRGGAPATREWELLDPQRTVARVDAVLLCGGSAFGLAAADGAMAWLEERGRGFPTPAGPVPIVVAAALYDLDAGDPAVRPDAAAGRAACDAAREGPAETGRVGAGAGATVGRWRGASDPGGLGGGLRREGELVVGALVAVNAFGDLRGGGGDGEPAPQHTPAPAPRPLESTTLAVTATNARLTKGDCLLVAQSAHDGLARALEPAHTRFDGDAAVAAATGAVAGNVDLVRVLAARAVEDAVRAALAPTPADPEAGKS
jgi:L-aminopeptidase/D-esterase-like protein